MANIMELLEAKEQEVSIRKGRVKWELLKSPRGRRMSPINVSLLKMQVCSRAILRISPYHESATQRALTCECAMSPLARRQMAACRVTHKCFWREKCRVTLCVFLCVSVCERVCFCVYVCAKTDEVLQEVWFSKKINQKVEKYEGHKCDF